MGVPGAWGLFAVAGRPSLCAASDGRPPVPNHRPRGVPWAPGLLILENVRTGPTPSGTALSTKRSPGAARPWHPCGWRSCDCEAGETYERSNGA